MAIVELRKTVSFIFTKTVSLIIAVIDVQFIVYDRCVMQGCQSPRTAAELRHTAQQTDISCRYTPGVASPGS